MNLPNLTTIMIIFLLTGCSKDDTIKLDCIESMLSENNMVAYNEQEIGCKFFFELFHYQSKQFYLLGNHCADITSYPIDCDGNSLCENGEDSECKDFYDNAQRIGIIGIDE